MFRSKNSTTKVEILLPPGKAQQAQGLRLKKHGKAQAGLSLLIGLVTLQLSSAVKYFSPAHQSKAWAIYAVVAILSTLGCGELFATGMRNYRDGNRLAP